MRDKTKPYIIGELAYNHEGRIDYLYKMIDGLAGTGVNAVKFHLLLNPESYMQSRHPLMPKVKEWVFTKDQWDSAIERSVAKGLDVVALCDDVESLQYINSGNKNVFAVEIHATGLNDWFLLNEAARFKGAVILGIGGSGMDEIEYAVNFLKSAGKNEIILMYGFQNYPTDYANINLSKMLKVRDLFKVSVGYADHTAWDDPNNEIISVMAATMGFNILEKHYTPDYGKERIDWQAAVGNEQMIRIRQLMDVALTVYGDESLKMSPGEIDYGKIGPMKKAIVARRNINKGSIISLDDLWFKRTKEESAVSQSQLFRLVGAKAKASIAADEIVDFNKVECKSEGQNK